MNTSMHIVKIKQAWNIAAMQKAATRMVSQKIASRINFLDKHHSKEVDEMEKASAHLHAEILTSKGIKSPMELAKDLAEYEVNMFGSEASISGDDDCAVLINDKSVVWLETIKTNNFSIEQISVMQGHYTAWMKHLGHRLGFKVHVEIGKDDSSSKVTFTRKA